MVQLSPELILELEQAGDQPLTVEDPRSKRVYVLVDTERYEVVRRCPTPLATECSTPSTGPQKARFLDQARRLDEHAQTDSALDIVFDQIDEMLLAGEFQRVDRLLAETSPETFSADLLVGILTATLPARKHLANRSAFFTSVQRALRNRGQLVDGLLVGLE
jgi:hypothetical protein